MSNTMLALVSTAEAVLEVLEEPMPEVGDHDVLIKVHRVGICGSDGGRFMRTNALLNMRHIGGHEYSGEVVETGKNVTQLKVGDRVTGSPIDYCAEPSCPYCTSGINQHCPNRRVMGAHPTWKSGAFAQFVASPAKLLRKLPAGLGYREAAECEPASCGTWNATLAERYSQGGLKGKNGVIIGAGPIGLHSLRAMKSKGADKVIVSDQDADRLKLVEGFGGIAFNANNHPPDQTATAMIRILGGKADFSLDAVGLGVTRDLCVEVTDVLKPTIWTGLHHESASAAAGKYVRFGALIVGAFGFTPAIFDETLQALADGKMGFGDANDELPLDQGQQSFDRLFRSDEPGKPTKIMLCPNGL